MSAETIPAAVLTGSKGSVTAHVGDRFKWWLDGAEWEIVGFTGDYIYSPSGFGGAQVVLCKHIAGENRAIDEKWIADGVAEWCGDSIASALISQKNTPDPSLSQSASPHPGEAPITTAIEVGCSGKDQK